MQFYYEKGRQRKPSFATQRVYFSVDTWSGKPCPLPGVERYNPDSPQWFDQLKSRFNSRLNRRCAHDRNIGSTSVPGMTAKSIIDILIAAKRLRQGQIAVGRATVICARSKAA